MSTKNGKDAALEWITEKSHEATQSIMDVLLKDFRDGLSGVPPEIVRAIHNMALFNVLKVINFPARALPSHDDLDDAILNYEADVERLRQQFSHMCEELADWKGKKPATPAKRKYRRREQVKKSEKTIANTDKRESPPAEGGSGGIGLSVAN